MIPATVINQEDSIASTDEVVKSEYKVITADDDTNLMEPEKEIDDSDGDIRESKVIPSNEEPKEVMIEDTQDVQVAILHEGTEEVINNNSEERDGVQTEVINDKPVQEEGEETSIPESDTSNYIKENTSESVTTAMIPEFEAMEIALESLGIKRERITELESEQVGDTYHVKFHRDRDKYILIINGGDASIRFKSIIESGDESTSNTVHNNESDNIPDNKDEMKNNTIKSVTVAIIPESEAVLAAYEAVGIKNSDVTKLETAQVGDTYHVKFFAKEKMYLLVVNGGNGSIRSKSVIDLQS